MGPGLGGWIGKTFWQVVKKKSTENYKSTPYITTLLSTSLWTFYGLLNPDGLLVTTVNGAGTVFQFIYVALFLIYAPQDKKVKTAKLLALLNVGFLGLVIAVTLLAIPGSVRLTVVGILCAGFTIGMYASPLSVMRMVIKTKSVEYMPFFLSFFLFLNGGIWSVYAVLVRDFYIGVPNAFGFVLGSIQLIIYAIYNKKSISKKSLEMMEEEGSAHLVKENEMGEFEEDEEANTFWQVVKKKSTENYKSIPYITTLLITSLWTLYGLLNLDGLLVTTVNGAVTLFINSYMYMSLSFSSMLLRIRSVQLAVFGILYVELTMCIYAPPLSIMGIVIKSKSVEYVPFFLFFNAGIWSIYMVLVKDFYIR
ncbi:bidirectional sugar transporter sweet17, partial [Quercus suber]